MFFFNEGIDTAIIKPVAQGDDAVLPTPVKTGVTNFFGNIADVFIAVNNLFQGKVPEAASDAGRFLVNSTVGISPIAGSLFGQRLHRSPSGAKSTRPWANYRPIWITGSPTTTTSECSTNAVRNLVLFLLKLAHLKPIPFISMNSTWQF